MRRFSPSLADPRVCALKHQIPVGSTPHKYNLSTTVSPSFSPTDEKFLGFAEFDRSGYDLIQGLNKNVGVKAVDKNVWTSLLKCDVSPKNPDNEIYLIAKEYSWRMLSQILTTVPMFRGLDFDAQKSPGKLYKLNGYKTKQEAIGTRLFYDCWLSNYTQIWSVSGKQESLPEVEVIDDHKIRTFMIPGVDFAMQQEFLYGNQDRNLVAQNDLTWVRYGMVREFGGVDRLFRSLEPCSFVWELDVSGWDRCVDLSDVYDLRERGLILPCDEVVRSRIEFLKEYVRENTCNSVMLYPDGSLVQSKTGNRSGSNRTTGDNCIKHVIVQFYHWLRMAVKWLGRCPEYSELLLYLVIHLYGDDNFGGIKPGLLPELTSDQMMEELVQSYSEFGLRIKDKAFKCENKKVGEPVGLTQELSFLGVTGVYCPEYRCYYPMPRRSNICFSLSKSLGGINDGIRARKTCALYRNAFMDPVLSPVIMSYLRYLLLALSKDHDETLLASDLEEIRDLVTRRVSPNFSVMGWERVGFDTGPVNFFRTRTNDGRQFSGGIKSSNVNRNEFPNSNNNSNTAPPTAPCEEDFR